MRLQLYLLDLPVVWYDPSEGLRRGSEVRGGWRGRQGLGHGRPCVPGTEETMLRSSDVILLAIYEFWVSNLIRL